MNQPNAKKDPSTTEDEGVSIESAAVALRPPALPDLSGALQDASEMLGNIGIADLTNWKLTSEGAFFSDGQGQAPTSLDGHIVATQATRAYWAGKFGQAGDVLPNCSSNDAVNGVGDFGPGSEQNPSGKCQQCPMSAFGTSDEGTGRGQACRANTLVYLLPDEPAGAILPDVVWAPATSHANVRRLLTKALANPDTGHRATGAHVTLRVTRASNANGASYPTIIGDLLPGNHQTELADQIASLVKPGHKSIAEAAALAHGQEVA